MFLIIYIYIWKIIHVECLRHKLTRKLQTSIPYQLPEDGRQLWPKHVGETIHNNKSSVQLVGNKYGICNIVARKMYNIRYLYLPHKVRTVGLSNHQLVGPGALSPDKGAGE
jgi:hypothetical protein